MRAHPALALALLLLAAPAAAQEAPTATAVALEAVADDGTIVRIGEVTGRITVQPAATAAQRFGRITVSAGIAFVARARVDSDIPVYATGNLGGVLRADGARLARVDALWRQGDAVVGRVVLGDAVLEGVSMARARVAVDGAAPLPEWFSWTVGDMAVREGTTTLCAAPGRGCVRLRTLRPLPVTEVGRAPAWTRVRAAREGITLDGWVPARAVLHQPGADIGWGAGRSGAIGDGCPYEGRPALVAGGTRVHLRPDGAAWAQIPANPDSVWVHDTAPGTPWVELTFARGVQRSFPRSTCSTGWVRRGAVTWDVLREGALTLAREDREDRVAVVVRAAPRWLLDGGLQPGDILLARIERGAEYAPHNLDDLRRALGIGGTFRIERRGAPRTLDLPLAPGCDPPGLGQPAACTPR